jgi:uncharacterized repeat protein (TIGR01451 family)
MLPRIKRGGYLMRIFVPLMLTLVVSVFLASCGGQEAPVEETEEEGSVEETSTGETTAEETSDRAKVAVEETTASAEVAATEPATTESTPEAPEGTGPQEEEWRNASPERTTRDDARPEGIGAVQTIVPDPATVGSPLTFVVVVTNNSFPQHVGFKDFLPPSVTFVSATPEQGFCGPPHHGGNLVDCTLGTIPTGGSVVVEIVAIPTAPGTTTNLAQAGGGFAPVQSVPATVTVNPQNE